MTEPTEPRKRGRPPGQTKPKSSTERNRAMRRRRINEETEAVGHEAEATTDAARPGIAPAAPGKRLGCAMGSCPAKPPGNRHRPPVPGFSFWDEISRHRQNPA